MSEYSSTPDVPELVRSLDLRIAALEAGPRGLWRAITLAGGWVEAGTKPGYVVDDFGYVHFRGRIGSGASGGTAFTLPVGVRPALGSDLYPLAAVGGLTPVAALAAVDGSTGTVELYYASAITTLSLRGISFLSER